MTPIFCCGFECGVSGSGAHVAIAGATFDTSIVRTGSRSLKITGPETNSSATLASTSVRVFRIYVYFGTFPTSSNQSIAYIALGGSNAGAWFNVSDNKIYAGTTAGGLGSTGVQVYLNTWHCLDVKLVSTSNPWTVDVSVDGVPCGQATNAVGLTNANFVTLGATTGVLYFDDWIISSTAADYPIGNGQVRHFIPTSDGTHNVAGTGDFQRTLTGTDILNATTTAFQLIDDVPLETGASVDWINMVAPPNATDYVECIFGPASGVPTPTYGPRTVEVIAGIHQSGTGTGNMEIRLNDNGSMGTIYTTPVAVAGTTSVIYKRAHFLDPPSAATVWGVASGNGNFNNVRMRFGSPAAVDANPDQYLDCIMIEAEFAEWPQKITQVKQAVNRSNTY